MKHFYALLLIGWLLACNNKPATNSDMTTPPTAEEPAVVEPPVAQKPQLPIKVNGKIIGQWAERERTKGTFIYYQHKGKYFMKMAFPDNSSTDSEVKRKQVWNGLRLTEVDNTNGEYYILTKDGSLGFYNKEGKRFTEGLPTR